MLVGAGGEKQAERRRIELRSDMLSVMSHLPSNNQEILVGTVQTVGKIQ